MSKTLDMVILHIPIANVANIAIEYMYPSNSKDPVADAFRHGYYEKCEQILSDHPSIYVESELMRANTDIMSSAY